MEKALQASILSLTIGGSKGNCEAITWERVVKESHMDPEIKELVELIRTGIEGRVEPWPANLTGYYRFRQELSEKDGVVNFKK